MTIVSRNSSAQTNPVGMTVADGCGRRPTSPQADRAGVSIPAVPANPVAEGHDIRTDVTSRPDHYHHPHRPIALDWIRLSRIERSRTRHRHYPPGDHRPAGRPMRGRPRSPSVSESIGVAPQ